MAFGSSKTGGEAYHSGRRNDNYSTRDRNLEELNHGDTIFVHRFS